VQKITDQNDWYWKDPSARAYGAEPTWPEKVIKYVGLEIVPKKGLSELPEKVERSEIARVMSQIDIDGACYRLCYGKQSYYFGDPGWNTPRKEYICNRVEVNVNFILGENSQQTKDPESIVEVVLIKDALQQLLDAHFPDWEVHVSRFSLYKAVHNPRVLKKCLKHDLDSHALDIDREIVYAKDNAIKCAIIRKIEWDAVADDVKYTLSNGDVTYFNQNPICSSSFKKTRPEITDEEETDE